MICATPAIVLLWGGGWARALGRALLALMVGWYWVSSLPVVADRLTALVSDQTVDVPTPSGTPIVILGNGSTSVEKGGFTIDTPRPQTALNILTGLERHRADPSAVIIASGGAAPGERMTPEAVAIRDQLVKNGVASAKVLLESSSTTTHEQVNGVTVILGRLHTDRCVLVTAPTHMRRAAAAFGRTGIIVYRKPALTEAQHAEANGWSRWLPVSAARATSGDAAYEIVATVYYWLRGWL